MIHRREWRVLTAEVNNPDGDSRVKYDPSACRTFPAGFRFSVLTEPDGRKAIDLGGTAPRIYADHNGYKSRLAKGLMQHSDQTEPLPGEIVKTIGWGSDYVLAYVADKLPIDWVAIVEAMAAEDENEGNKRHLRTGFVGIEPR